MLIKIGDFEFTEVWDWSEKVYRLIESSRVKKQRLTRNRQPFVCNIR